MIKLLQRAPRGIMAHGGCIPRAVIHDVLHPDSFKLIRDLPVICFLVLLRLPAATYSYPLLFFAPKTVNGNCKLGKSSLQLVARLSKVGRWEFSSALHVLIQSFPEFFSQGHCMSNFKGVITHRYHILISTATSLTFRIVSFR